jgi:hypothetical protein
VAEKVGVMPETKLLFTSFKVTVMVEVATPLATTDEVPVMVEVAATATSAVKITLPSAFMKGVAMESIFVSDFSELKVQVETPREFVAEQRP